MGREGKGALPHMKHKHSENLAKSGLGELLSDFLTQGAADLLTEHWAYWEPIFRTSLKVQAIMF